MVIEDVSDSVRLRLQTTDPRKLSLETLALFNHTGFCVHTHDQSKGEMTQLKGRQNHMHQLHNMLKGINHATNDKGELDLTNNPELRELLSHAQDYGIPIDPTKMKYTERERDRLVDNIKTTTKELNFLIDSHMQKITHFNNMYYESFQQMRLIMKPLHEAKQRAARASAGGGG